MTVNCSLFLQFSKRKINSSSVAIFFKEKRILISNYGMTTHNKKMKIERLPVKSIEATS